MLFVIITAVLAGILSVESIPNRDCAEPPTIPYAQIEKTSTTHGSYVTYAFQDPYKLIGYPRAQCLYGEWISKPICNNVDCSVPKVEHGNITEKIYGDRYWNFWTAKYEQAIQSKTVPAGTLANQSAIYYLHCHSGYSFHGSSDTERRITCTESNWHPDPICIPTKCVELPVIRNGKPILDHRNPPFSVNTSISYECDKFYKTEEMQPTVTCILRDNIANWTEAACKQITCTAPKFPNGHIIGIISSVYNASDIIILQCNDGTHRVPAKCTEIGEWSVRPPTCRGKCKEQPPDVRNGRIASFDRKHGSKVQYQCDESFVMKRQSSVFCNVDKWEGDPPLCQKSKCEEEPPRIQNGRVYFFDRDHGSEVRYQCDENFEILKESSVVCNVDKWEGDPPRCQEISMCSTESLLLTLPEKVLPDLKNVTDKYVPYGTELQFLCGQNSFLSGSQKAKCGRQGIWEYGAVRCIQGCVLGEITPQLSVEPSKKFYSFGETITFKCPFGQKLSSEVRRVMCLGTSWSDAIPGCVEVVYR